MFPKSQYAPWLRNNVMLYALCSVVFMFLKRPHDILTDFEVELIFTVTRTNLRRDEAMWKMYILFLHLSGGTIFPNPVRSNISLKSYFSRPPMEKPPFRSEALAIWAQRYKFNVESTLDNFKGCKTFFFNWTLNLKHKTAAH